MVPGQPVSLRVVVRNALGLGEPSDRIQLIPAALPKYADIGPAAIRVTEYGLDGSLALEWDVPADTGGSDAGAAVLAISPTSLHYMLEVDEGFYEGVIGSPTYTALTSNDPTGLVKQTAVSFMHTNLIVGHTYRYRVKAANLMGYGPYSAVCGPFIPRKRPGTPPLAPRNRPTSTTDSAIFIDFDAVLETGGAAITEYKVYLDDGTDSDVIDSCYQKYELAECQDFAPHSSATTLSWNTGQAASLLALTPGLTYRLKYSASNVAGEGPLSPEVSILLAKKPEAPPNLRRISTQTLPAGSISVKWDEPTAEGGTPITGYVIYLDTLVYYNSTDGESTLSEYTLTSLTVGRLYAIAVAAKNRIGEGPTSSLSLLSASLPPKLAMPDFHSASSSSIFVNASIPSYDGGSPITAYVYRRDDGPLTAFQAQTSLLPPFLCPPSCVATGDCPALDTTSWIICQTTSLAPPLLNPEGVAEIRQEFSGLDSAKRVYSFQMAAVNSLGQGPWSETVSFHATSPPGNPSSFTVAAQSTTSITVQWAAPAEGAGDCAVEGYRVLLEDILQPGFQVVHNGIRSSSTTSLTLGYPTIRPSRYYRLLLQAKNCG